MFPNDHSPSQDTARQTSSLTLYSSSTILQTKAPWLYNIPGHRVWRHTKEFLEPFIISSNVQFDLRCLNRSNRNHIKAKTRVQTTQAIPLAFVLYPAALPRREVRAAAGHCTRRAATPMAPTRPPAIVVCAQKSLCRLRSKRAGICVQLTNIPHHCIFMKTYTVKRVTLHCCSKPCLCPNICSGF